MTKRNNNTPLKVYISLFALFVILSVVLYLNYVPTREKNNRQNIHTEVSDANPPLSEITDHQSPSNTTSGHIAVPKSIQSKFDNLTLGIPSNADAIIDREGYALGYVEYHEQPAWVIYKLTAWEVVTKNAKRKNEKFKEDPEISTGSAALADYRGSGYDRGHLAPAADMAFSVKTMGDSFYMSNMSPQAPAFNRGIWAALELQVRAFAQSEGEIYVVTGPILPKEKKNTIGANKVTVPEYYYKVVYDLTPPEKMIGFIIPNAGSNKSLKDFTVTVDQVEEATGLDFFNLIPQEELESTITITNWSWISR